MWSCVCFQPIGHQGNLIPDPEADYELFDRVVNVSISNAVPFGLQGTVSGILGGGLIATPVSRVYIQQCSLTVV